MNVVCIYSVSYYERLDKPLATQCDIHFGLASIASALKEAGFNVDLLIITPDTNIKETLMRYFRGTHQYARLFCLTAVSSEYNRMCEVAKEIKQLNKYGHINMGGVHVSLNPESAIECQYIDSICIGEGDRAIVELAKELENGTNPTKINNLWFKLPSDQALIERNPQDTFIEDLDSLPIIDHSLWYPFIKDPVAMPAVLAGRGCPNKCSYCSNHKLRNISPGKYVRFRSPWHILKELNTLWLEQPGIKSFYLEVETLSINIPYALELCESLKAFNKARNINMEFRVNISLYKNLLQDEKCVTFLRALKSANVTTINIGLESGSERIRKDILNRPDYSNKDIIQFSQLAKLIGLKTSLYIIMGLPTETHNDFLETLFIILKCEPDYVQYGFFFPYPGTDIYKYALEKPPFNPSFERKRPYFDTKEFTKKQQIHEYIWMPVFLYNNKLPFYSILILMLKNYVVQSDTLTKIFMRLRSLF